MNITKEVTGTIINQSDQAAKSIIVHDFNENDSAIFCSLLDVNGETITTKRVFSYDNFPCQALNLGEKELIKGMNPTDQWYIEEIKLWLDSREVEYESNALKSELLFMRDAGE